MITDIDRLHKVIDGKAHGRGCGKTFAKCHEVAGLIELGYKYVFCMITHQQDQLYLDKMLTDVFNDHGLEIKRVSMGEYYVNDSLVRLIPENDYDMKTRGCEGAMVKMRHFD
jgi:hypothetical protein